MSFKIQQHRAIFNDLLLLLCDIYCQSFISMYILIQASKYERNKKSPTYKDLDFMEHHPEGILLEADTYKALMNTLERDCRVSNSLQWCVTVIRFIFLIYCRSVIYKYGMNECNFLVLGQDDVLIQGGEEGGCMYYSIIFIYARAIKLQAQFLNVIQYSAYVKVTYVFMLFIFFRSLYSLIGLQVDFCKRTLATCQHFLQY